MLEATIRYYVQAMHCRGKWATIREMTNKGYSERQIAKVVTVYNEWTKERV